MEHIYKGVLFIFDRHHLEHAGFICAKSQSCVVVGGSRSNGDRTVSFFKLFCECKFLFLFNLLIMLFFLSFFIFLLTI